MVDQAQVENRGGADSPPRAVARNAAEFLHDVVTLVELQASLLKIDIRQSLGRLVMPIIALVVGAIVLLSCVPILLASVALLLVETLEWTYAQAFFCSLGIGLVLGGIACLAGVWFIRRSFDPLARSRTEFVQNFTWVKQMLKRLGTMTRTPVVAAERWNGR
jgi:protein-S-isoprenylcysteine O-methyltransferase Ste14